MDRGTTHIAIIGGGFCGVMTTVHLLRSADTPLKITLINSGYPLGKGVAYSAYSKQHLLNVTAGNMSAFPDKPADFVDWIHNKEGYTQVDKSLLSKTYLPRYLYGEYIEGIWKNALSTKKADIELDVIDDTAIDVEVNDNGVAILLKKSQPLAADKLVIATGNSEPRNPEIPGKDFFSSPSYFRDSWKGESVSNLKSENDILIIGNGLTMVDTVLGLIENGFSKTIYSISPNGFGILPHRHGGMEYSGLKNEISKPYELSKLVNLTHKHIRVMRNLGLSAEPIIDSLRPLTQEIWQSLSLSERKHFLTRLRHLWGVARHRLPVHVHDMMQNLRINGNLVVMAGTVKNITETADGIKVILNNKKTKKEETITVERVINCTGPESSIKKSNNTLLQNMWKRGIATTDALELGINADVESFRIIDKYGDKLPNIYTLGANLRGMLWESSAVPELRVQVEKLAQKLIA